MGPGVQTPITSKAPATLWFGGYIACGAESGRAFCCLLFLHFSWGPFWGGGAGGPWRSACHVPAGCAGSTWTHGVGALCPRAGLAQSPSRTWPRPLARLALQVWPPPGQAGGTALGPGKTASPPSPRDFIHPSGLYVPAVPAPHLSPPSHFSLLAPSVPHSASLTAARDPRSLRSPLTPLPQEKVRCAGISPSSARGTPVHLSAVLSSVPRGLPTVACFVLEEGRTFYLHCEKRNPVWRTTLRRKHEMSSSVQCSPSVMA